MLEDGNMAVFHLLQQFSQTLTSLQVITVVVIYALFFHTELQHSGENFILNKKKNRKKKEIEKKKSMIS